MGKKVGILSMQRVINYGSYLQSYALRRMLLDAGAHEVSFIDIKPGRQLAGYKTSGFSYIIKRLKALSRIIVQGRMFSKQRTMRFMAQVSQTIQSSWKDLTITDCPQYDVKCDLAVIGSDEVFHCCQSTKWGFTKQLYGDIPSADKVCSYAASFGATTLIEINNLGIGEEISTALKKMSSISVRDANSYKIIEAIGGVKPYVHIDPVLAYGFKNELEKVPKENEKNYILIYSYPDRINDRNEIKAIVKFARKYGKKLISVMSRYDWCDRAVIPTPLELLAWVKNADYVISETFHGSIFAIIAHKPFVTIGRDSSMPKLTSMLEPYGLSERLLTSVDSLENVMNKEIDYYRVERMLNVMRMDTKTYFKTILS